MNIIKCLAIASILLTIGSTNTYAEAVYAGDNSSSGLSDFRTDYVGGQRSTSSSCGPIAPSSSTVWWFTIDGMPYSSHTEWYVTSSGGTVVDTDDLYAYFDPQVGIKFTSSGTYTIRAEIWVSGSWVQAHRFTVTIQQPSCTVTFNKQNGFGGSDSITATYGSAMPSATAPSRSGYSFQGYYSSTSGGGTKYYNANMSSANNWDKTQNTTIYAYWAPNTYTVTLNKQNGFGGSSSVAATFGYAMPSATAPSRTDYIFQGYYDGTDGGGNKYYNANMSSAKNWDKTADSTFYAYWTAIPKPDLEVLSVTRSATSYKTGDKIASTVTVRNRGDKSSGYFDVQYYLGTASDKTYRPIEGGTFLLGLGAGDSGTDEINSGGWTIPEDIPSGTYYIWVKSDSGGTQPNGQVSEGDESNNWGQSGSFTVTQRMPDLEVPLVTRSSISYKTGDKIASTVTVRNRGDKASGYFEVQYYLGTASDKTYRLLESGTFLLGLNAGDSGTDEINSDGWTIPADMPSGTYYIWVKSDSGGTQPNGQVAESDESNNWGQSASFTITQTLPIRFNTDFPPDLTDKNYLPNFDPDRFDDIDGDGSKDTGWTINSSRCFAPGDTIITHATVKNSGSVSRQVRVTVYRNASINTATMTAVGSAVTHTLSANATRRFAVQWTAPTTTGRYYVYVKVESESGGTWSQTDGAWVDGGDAADFVEVTSAQPIVMVHGWWGRIKQAETADPSQALKKDIYPEGDGENRYFGNLELIIERTMSRPVRYYEYFSTWSLEPGTDPNPNTEQLAEHLSNFVATPANNLAEVGQFDIVCHSYGGLVSRSYDRISGGRVRKLVALASPHYGAWAAYFAPTPQGVDLRFGSGQTLSLHGTASSDSSVASRYLAVIGTDSDLEFGQYNDDDGVVHCESASLENVGVPVYYVPKGHGGVASNGDGWESVHTVADSAHPSWPVIWRFLGKQNESGVAAPFDGLPGNSDGVDNVGRRDHSHALGEGGLYIAANTAEGFLNLAANHLSIRKATSGFWYKNVFDINSADWDGDGKKESIACIMNQDADDAYSGTERYSDYDIELDYPGYPKTVKIVRVKAGETTVLLFDFLGIPATPVPEQPGADANINTLTPPFSWSAFSSPAGRTQAGFQMRVRCDTDGDVVVYDTGFIANTSGRTHPYTPGTYTGVDAVSGDLRVSQALQYGKQYHWHVRYRDSAGVWSAWSADTPNPMRYFQTLQTGTFTIYSAHGSPNPAAGSVTWTSGQVMPDGSVVSPADAVGGRRWRCTGYTGSGSAPSGSGTNYPSFTITQDSTLRWNWIEQVQINSSAGPNGQINPSDTLWNDVGENFSFTATPSSGFVVDQWWVNGTVAQQGGTILTLTDVRQPTSVEVAFRAIDPSGVRPIIADVPDQTASSQVAYVYTPSLLAGNPAPSWVLVSGPNGMVIDPSTGTVSWPNPEPVGESVIVRIRASNTAGSDDVQWTITVPDTSNQVDSPIFSPDGGSKPGSNVCVTLTIATEGATIRYTIDGTDPTESSAAYIEPLILPLPAVLKAKAWKDGMAPSEISMVIYSLENNPDAVSLEGNSMWNRFAFFSWRNVTHVYEPDSNNAVIDTWKADDNGNGDPRDDENRIRLNGRTDMANGIQFFRTGINACESGWSVNAYKDTNGNGVVMFERTNSEGVASLCYTLSANSGDLHGELNFTPSNAGGGFSWGYSMINNVWVDSEPGEMALYDKAYLNNEIIPARPSALNQETEQGIDFLRAENISTAEGGSVSTEKNWKLSFLVTEVSTPVDMNADVIMASVYGGWGFGRSCYINKELQANEQLTVKGIFRASAVTNSPNNKQLVVSSYPSEGGTVSGGGTFEFGSTQTVTAVANSGYSFVNWTEEGTVVSSDATYTFALTRDRSLAANFKLNDKFFIVVSANPAEGGSVSGGGAFESGSTQTVTAVANSGYSFVNWTEEGTVVSSDATYTFALTRDRSLAANFKLNDKFFIVVSANPAEGGSVSGGGIFESGSTRTVTASATAGYTFVNWTENGQIVSSSSSYTFVLDRSRSLVANFLAPMKGLIQFKAGGLTVSETTRYAVLRVIRTGGSAGRASVKYTTRSKTAVSGSDYFGKSGTLTWGDGDASQRRIRIPIINDSITEPSEIFKVVLSNPTGASLSRPYIAKITIPANVKNGDQTTFTDLRDSIASAVDNAVLTWTTKMATPWTGQTAISADGQDSAKSGRPSAGQSSWLETKVEGTGKLEFDWTVRGYGLETCLLIVDGEVRGAMLPGYGWIHEALTLGEGTHTVRWVFLGDSVLSSGSAYVDQVKWTTTDLQ